MTIFLMVYPRIEIRVYVRFVGDKSYGFVIVFSCLGWFFVPVASDQSLQ